MKDNQQPKRSPFFNTSLQWVIVLPFVLQVFGVVGLVGYLSYRSGQEAIEEITNQLMENTGQQVTQKLDRYLKTAHNANQRHIAAIESGVISLQNLDQLHRYLILQHLQNSDLTTFLFGTPQGDFRICHYVNPRELGSNSSLRSDDMPYEAGLSKPSPSSKEFDLYSINASGDLVRYLETFSNSDVRDRPWYRLAVETKKAGWSKPFLIGSTDVLALNAYQPFYDKNQNLLGVFAVNISLNQLSQFLSSLKVGRTGKVFIIENNGLLIANSTTQASYFVTDPSNFNRIAQFGTRKFNRLSAQDIAEPDIQRSYQYLKSTFTDLTTLRSPQRINFWSNGNHYFLNVTPYNDTYGLNWLIVTVVPESDFTVQIRANVERTILLCGLALLTAVGIGIWTSRRITRSLLQLTQTARSFAESRLEQPIPDTNIHELRVLTEALHQMMHDLRDADQMRLNYEQDLEWEVANKTIALTEVQRIARVGSWTFDVATGTSNWSAEQFQILGFDPNLPLPSYANFFDLLPKDDQPKLRKAVEEAIAHGTPYTEEHGIIRPDGSICYIISRGEAIRNDQGQVIKLVGTIIDISDRKRLEVALQVSENKLNDILNSVAAAVTRLLLKQDGDWEIVYVSKGCKDVCGYTSGELITDKSLWLSIINPEDWQPIEAQVFADIRTECSGTYVYRILHKNGTWRWISQTNHSCWDATQNAWSVTIISTDISDRKQAEIVLAKAKETAEAATKAKSEFLANMSHEIRTPMNGVIGMTQMLQTTELTKEQQDFVNTISESGEVLLAVINDILDFSKIESGMLTIESREFCLQNVVSSVGDILHSQAIAKNIDLQYMIAPDIPNLLIGDQTRLRQILLNLIGNAIKFTPQGQVSISVNGRFLKANQYGKYQLEFAIADTGIGIQGDRLQQLFQAFTQADASISRKYGGTGLGLVISKRLVELMGGRIWVESFGQVGGNPPLNWQTQEPSQGSTFYFTISVSVSAAIGEPQASIAPKANKLLAHDKLAEMFPLRILLVEDNIVNQMVATRLLQKLGYQADLANNGLEAIEAVQKQIYDLIFMDVQMPEMDGLTATKLIREYLMDSKHKVQIVAMTANAMPEDRQACLDAGMNAYISKPINIQEIIRLIK